VLQFYVSFYLFTPHVAGTIFPAMFSNQVVQSCH
jgi:hypothetical protein